MRLVLMLGCAMVASVASAQQAAETVRPELTDHAGHGGVDPVQADVSKTRTLPPVAGQAPNPSPDNHSAMKGEHQPAAAPGNANARNPDPR